MLYWKALLAIFAPAVEYTFQRSESGGRLRETERAGGFRQAISMSEQTIGITACSGDFPKSAKHGKCSPFPYVLKDSASDQALFTMVFHFIKQNKAIGTKEKVNLTPDIFRESVFLHQIFKMIVFPGITTS